MPLGCQLQIDRAPVLPSSVVKSYPLDADVKRYFNDKNLQSSMSIQGNHQDMNSTAVDATAKVTATATATAAATATKMRNITQSQPGNPQSIYSPSEYHPAEAYIPVLTTVQTNLSAASRGKIKIYKKQVYLNSGVSLGTASVYKKIFDRAVGLINNELPELCLEDQGIISW